MEQYQQNHMQHPMYAKFRRPKKSWNRALAREDRGGKCSTRNPSTFLPHSAYRFKESRPTLHSFDITTLSIILFILFPSLLWHPVLLIVFLIMISAWLFLYFLRDDPLVIYGIEIQDNVVMTLLSAATIFLLCFMSVTDNMIVALFLVVVVVLVHGAFRTTDDLEFMEDEEGFGSVGILRQADALPKAATVTVPL